ncbi:hypothetical protein OGATHE_001327 [Ogataea polymorpha]|uniref:Secreted protein n=1 Tax=Ogataea polymorpha TaxID=460523 RepID=A0A9P8PRL6_9ASCO|nr:hypothetical protein OGATHE_001327 [Ogataea polymorpha]
MKSTELLILLWWFGDSSTTSSLVMPSMRSACDTGPDAALCRLAADMLSGRDLDEDLLVTSGRANDCARSDVDLLLDAVTNLVLSSLANGSCAVKLCAMIFSE